MSWTSKTLADDPEDFLLVSMLVIDFLGDLLLLLLLLPPLAATSMESFFLGLSDLLALCSLLTGDPGAVLPPLC